MNILFLYTAGGLGDTLALLPFFKDCKQQYPDYNLYIKYPYPNNMKYFTQRDQIFFNNPYVKVFHQNSSFKIDRVFDISDIVFKADANTETLAGRLYRKVRQDHGLNVIQKTFDIPWFFTEDELKLEIKSSKPVCLINVGYADGANSKNYGICRYQEIVDALYDRISFIQLGQTNISGFHQPMLHHVTDCLNKLSLRQIAVLIYKADFMLINLSGFNIFSGIPAKNYRTSFVLCGNREPITYTGFLKGQKFQQLVINSGKKYDCDKPCCISSLNECANVVTLENGERICKCMEDVTTKMIIEKFEERLEKFKK